MTIERSQMIINNLLCEIVDKTEIGKEDYYNWLKSEIGLSDDEIIELQVADCFPEP